MRFLKERLVNKHCCGLLKCFQMTFFWVGMITLGIKESGVGWVVSCFYFPTCFP